jgi:hypothetical protein
MSHRKFTFKVAVAITSFLLGLNHSAAAVELAPSPGNLPGNTITISTLDVQSNADPYSNAGNITIANGGKLATFNQFDNTGDYNSNGNFIVSLGGQLANAASFTIDTGATLGNFGTINNNKKRITNGQYFYNYSTGVFNNNFNPDLTAPRTYLRNGNIMYNYGAMVNGSDFYNEDLASLSNSGNWTNLAGSYSISSGNFNNYGTISNAGTFTNNPHYVNPGFGRVENYGAFNNLSGGVVNNNDHWYNRATGVINNAGVFNNSFPAFGIKNEGTINNLAGGTFTNSTGIGSYGQINNAGSFIINAGASVNGVVTATPDVSSYKQTAGVTVVNGNLGAALIDIQGGTLMGAGTLSGPVLLGAGATVNPGNSPGTLTVNGDFTSSGNLKFEIAGLGAGQFDVLKINGAATFNGGNVAFDFLGGFNAVAGNSWDFLLANSYSGQNSLAFTFNGLSAGLEGNVSYTATGWHLSIANVSAVPEPASAWYFAAGMLCLLGVMRRKNAA